MRGVISYSILCLCDRWVLRGLVLDWVFGWGWISHWATVPWTGWAVLSLQVEHSAERSTVLVSILCHSVWLQILGCDTPGVANRFSSSEEAFCSSNSKGSTPHAQTNHTFWSSKSKRKLVCTQWRLLSLSQYSGTNLFLQRSSLFQ